MSTIYVPRLIESAEQAEALPIGTVAHEPPHLYAYIKRGRNYWRETGDGVPLTDYEMLPFTALVPIEAEEETVERHRLCQPVPDVLHRYTTPWVRYTPIREAT